MYKVIRICDLTGRVNTVAECVTLEQANEIIVARAKADEFGDYRKVKINPRAELTRAVINLITKG
jgi:hypothetical protein